jgi:6-phosphogluconolactonase
MTPIFNGMSSMVPVKKFQVFATKSELYERAVACLQEAAIQASAAGKTFRLAVSGGSSAIIFRHLHPDYSLENWHFYQVDERFVPRDHPDSNFRFLQELTSGRIVNMTAFPLPESGAAEGAAIYEKCLKADENGFLFDCTILGVGPDGHTASLFPHGSALDSESLSLTTSTDVFAVSERMTLGFAAIARSRRILVLLAGTEKKPIYEQLVSDAADYHEYPVCRLLSLDYPVVVSPELYFLYAEV